MLESESNPLSPKAIPAMKNPSMTRLPPIPLQMETPFPDVCSVTGIRPASVDSAPFLSVLPPIFFHNSQANAQLPAIPPMLSTAAARPMDGSALITSLSLPVSQPRNRSSSQVTAIMGFWSPFIRSNRPETIPAAMQAITLNILCLYYPLQLTAAKIGIFGQNRNIVGNIVIKCKKM